MTVRVVELLESIEIENKDCAGVLSTMGSFELLIEPRDYRAMIW